MDVNGKMKKGDGHGEGEGGESGKEGDEEGREAVISLLITHGFSSLHSVRRRERERDGEPWLCLYTDGGDKGGKSRERIGKRIVNFPPFPLH